MVKIALAQIPTTVPEENCKRILTYLNRAAKQGAELIQFPEFSLQQWMPKFEDVKPYIKRIGNECKKLEVYALVGAFAPSDGKIFNQMYLLNPHGELQHTHTKMYLFWKEARFATPGEPDVPVETDFGKVGVINCWEIMNPKITKDLVKQGAQLILCSSDFIHYDHPTKGYEERIKTVPQQLALENRVFLTLCDTYRPKPKGADPANELIEYSYGYSRIINPNGTILKSIKGKEGMIYRDLRL